MTKVPRCTKGSSPRVPTGTHESQSRSTVSPARVRIRTSSSLGPPTARPAASGPPPRPLSRAVPPARHRAAGLRPPARPVRTTPPSATEALARSSRRRARRSSWREAAGGLRSGACAAGSARAPRRRPARSSTRTSPEYTARARLWPRNRRGQAARHRFERWRRSDTPARRTLLRGSFHRLGHRRTRSGRQRTAALVEPSIQTVEEGRNSYGR